MKNLAEKTEVTAKVYYMRRVENLGSNDTVESVIEQEIIPERMWETAPSSLSVEEASTLLGVGINQMYKLCRREDFPAVKFGAKYRIPKELLRDWFLRNAQDRVEIQVND